MEKMEFKSISEKMNFLDGMGAQTAKIMNAAAKKANKALAAAGLRVEFEARFYEIKKDETNQEVKDKA